MVNGRALQDKPDLWSIRHDFSNYLLVENSFGQFLSKYTARYILESLPELKTLRFVDEGSYIWHKAYLSFENRSGAEEAIERLNNLWISAAIVHDLLVNIEKIYSYSRRCRESWEWFNDSAIIADNLGSTDPNMLKATFCEYGKIRYIHVGSVHEDGTRVCAIIVYSTLVEAVASIFGMHDTEFQGKKISVKLFINDKEKVILSKINSIRYKVSIEHVCHYLENYDLPDFNNRAKNNWNNMSEISVEDCLNDVLDDSLAEAYFGIRYEEFFPGENLSSVHNEASSGDGSIHTGSEALATDNDFNHTSDKAVVVDGSNNVNEKKSEADGSSGTCVKASARAGSGRIRDGASAGNCSSRILDKASTADNLNGMDGETSNHKNGTEKKFAIAERKPEKSGHKSTGCTSNGTSRQGEEMTVSNNVISTDLTKTISRVVNNAGNPAVQIPTEYLPIEEASEVYFPSSASGSMTHVPISGLMLSGPFQQPNLDLVFTPPFQQPNQDLSYLPFQQQIHDLSNPPPFQQPNQDLVSTPSFQQPNLDLVFTPSFQQPNQDLVSPPPFQQQIHDLSYPPPFQQQIHDLVFTPPFQHQIQEQIFHPLNPDYIKTLYWEQLHRRDQNTSFQTQNRSVPLKGNLMRNINGNQKNISPHDGNLDNYEICREVPSANRNYRESDGRVPGTSSYAEYYFENEAGGSVSSGVSGNEAGGNVSYGVGGNEAGGSVSSGVSGNEAGGNVSSGVGGNEAGGSVSSGAGGNKARGSGSPVDWNNSLHLSEGYVNRKQKKQKALQGKTGNDENRQNSRTISKDGRNKRRTY